MVIINNDRLNKVLNYALKRELYSKSNKLFWRNLQTGIRNKYMSILTGETP